METRKELRLVKIQLADLQGELHQANNLNKVLKSQLSTLTEHIDDTLNQNSQLNQNIKDLKHQMEADKEKACSKQTMLIEEYESKLSKQNYSIKQNQTAINILQTEVEHYKSLLSQAETLLKEVSKRHISTQKELEDTKKVFNSCK